MKRTLTQLAIMSVLFLGCCAGVFAQATSQISGTVKDASGAVVGGAQVTVTQTATGVSADRDDGCGRGIFAAEPADWVPTRCR